MRGFFLFLGTGASSGVPLIGCSCPVCHSANPRNQRLRSAGLLRIGDKTLLIDVGPDFRATALKYKVQRLDGVLLTHTHFDHIAGIDELRVFNHRQKQPMPLLLSQESLDDLHIRYYYLFRQNAEERSESVAIEPHVLPGDFGKTHFAGIEVGYASYIQSSMKVNGFRVGNFAYVSDIRQYGEEMFSFLEGVETLVLSALRAEPSHVHFSLSEAAEFAHKAGVKETYLTHLSHAVEHADACKSLPPDVQPGYDGQELFFEV